ncbi:hypothetical protein VNO80_30110 [Phaseolus coccineus]|uniref:Uncharacterized protein n=1 Tax=Phaseolus coccineus TaxID=3886 RepID=A0AAN9LC80_PHACN
MCFRIFQTHPSLSLSNTFHFLSLERFNIGACQNFQSQLCEEAVKGGGFDGFAILGFVELFGEAAFGFSVVFVVRRSFASLAVVQFMLCLRRLMMLFCRFRVVLTDLRGFSIAMFASLPYSSIHFGSVNGLLTCIVQYA